MLFDLDLGNGGATDAIAGTEATTAIGQGVSVSGWGAPAIGCEGWRLGRMAGAGTRSLKGHLFHAKELGLFTGRGHKIKDLSGRPASKLPLFKNATERRKEREDWGMTAAI